jgi:hypothetical protein
MRSLTRRTRRAAVGIATVGAAAAAAGIVGPLGVGASAANSSPSALSSTPKEVVINPSTGSVQSITQLSPTAYQALLAAAAQASGASGGASPDISNHNICDTGNACYYTNQVPYADQGFYGTAGTFTGSWPYRNAFDTGNYDAEACWSSHCTGEWGRTRTSR